LFPPPDRLGPQNAKSQLEELKAQKERRKQLARAQLTGHGAPIAIRPFGAPIQAGEVMIPLKMPFFSLSRDDELGVGELVWCTCGICFTFPKPARDMVYQQRTDDAMVSSPQKAVMALMSPPRRLLLEPTSTMSTEQRAAN
jgi:hypothetical protein